MDASLCFEELRRQPHWSFSSLNQILNICSQQYAYRKIHKAKPEFTPVNLVFGSVFHKALSFYFSIVMEGNSIPEEELHQYFRRLFAHEVKTQSVPVVFAKENEEALLADKGCRMLSAFLEGQDSEDKVIGLDIPFSVEVPGVSKPLIGEYDAVVENKGRLIIVDFKTSASKWPADKAHKDMQATAYLYALRQTHTVSSLFRYDVITKTNTSAYLRYYTDRTSRDFERFSRLVQMAERVVDHELFYPHETSFACKGCPFGSSCSSWTSNEYSKAA